MSKSALGRGLGALLGGALPGARPAAPVPAVQPVAPPPAPAPVPATAPARVEGGQLATLPVARLKPCSIQPRKEFDAQALADLAESLKSQGVIQPLLVRPVGDHFEIVAGERRWRAAQMAGLTEVPVIIREVDDLHALELAMVENLQRENLNPLEEALGFAQLCERFQLTQEEASRKVGKSRVQVANALRLLRLSPECQAFVRDGRLSVGHAKAILGLSTGAEQNMVGEKVIREGLSVRQTEELIGGMLGPRGAGRKAGRSSSAAVAANTQVNDLESKLRDRFGTKVALRYKAGKGSVEIRFFSDDELNRILQIAGVQID